MIDGPVAALRAAKSQMARALLASDRGVDPRLGELTLRPHQLTAVQRLLEIIGRHRGALLADAVGLGKTYVALAIAREFGETVIVCPAALRGMWDRAMRATGARHTVVSTESLSRGTLPTVEPDLLVIDEAHHFRTPGTRRYEAVARLALQARVLLLTATPLNNSRRDLTSVLALFAGTAVTGWTDRALARLIVRRDDQTADQSLPPISGPHPLSPGEDDDCLDAILALPPAVPAADEGVAHALSTISLVHLWTSSRAALVASVEKRLARAIALHDAVASGHLPTASELAAWSYADGALQLAFPLFTPDEHVVDQHSLHRQLAEFIDRARLLLHRCHEPPDPDLARVELLRAARRRHHGQRMVAFSQYAQTIAALGRSMRGDPGIAVVTSTSARIASGPVPREYILEQFMAEPPAIHPAERIDLLLTTDLLSEGIDLRGASVVVHLDLPWNPARMEQRVGRTRRIGSRFDAIHVYTFVPPTAAERLIELRRRLSQKIRMARDIVGGSIDPLGQPEPGESPVTAGELLRKQMQEWLVDAASDTKRLPAVAAAIAPSSGWIATVITGGVARLIGDAGNGITDDIAMLSNTVGQIGEAVVVRGARQRCIIESIRDWLAARDAAADAGHGSAARRAVLDRLTQAIARAPRHRRSGIIAVAQRTRRALERVTGIGTEHILTSLARSEDDDDTWLQSVHAFGATYVGAPRAEAESRLVALIMLEPISAVDATPG